jgi:signal peptidase II
MKAPKLMRFRYYVITALVFFLDHATKFLVRQRLEVDKDSIEVIAGYLRISHVHNYGVAFGLFADIQSVWKPFVLASMAVVAVVVILMYSARMPSQRMLLQLALALTLGGIVGNFTDRILHGFVVDFIELHVHDAFHWPTFNVADSAITVGIALLLLDTIKHPDVDEEGAGQRAAERETA